MTPPTDWSKSFAELLQLNGHAPMAEYFDFIESEIYKAKREGALQAINEAIVMTGYCSGGPGMVLAGLDRIKARLAFLEEDSLSTKE